MTPKEWISPAVSRKNAEVRKAMESTLGPLLTDDERKVLDLYYPEDEDIRTFQKIGSILAKERLEVRDIRDSAIDKLGLRSRRPERL